MTPNFFDVFGEHPGIQDLSLEEAAKQLRDHVRSYRYEGMADLDPFQRAERMRTNSAELKRLEIQLCMAAMAVTP